MSRWKWSPLRHVAENIRAGDRSYWNLLKIPELSYSRASEAISEMERNGVLSVTGYRVEPTVAFGPWLTELRRREDLGVAVQPAEQPVTAPQEAAPQKTPVPTRTVKRKRYFAHLSSDRYEAGMEMGARIKELIEANGGTMRLSALKRSLHADRHPAAWEEALRRLVIHRVAKVAGGSITLTRSGNDLFPDPYGRPRLKRRKRHRGQSEWFENNRAKMDAGQHADFHEDWSDEEDDLAAAEAFWRQLNEKGPEG